MRAVSQQRLTVNIIKWALFGAVMILLFVMLARSAGAISTADITMIQTNVSEAADKEKMKEGDNRMLRRLYGIDPELLMKVLTNPEMAKLLKALAGTIE